MTFRQKLEDLLGLDIKMLMDKNDMQFMTKRNSYSLALKKRGGGLNWFWVVASPSVRHNVCHNFASALYIENNLI